MSKIKALAASVANMERLGEAKGDADKALWAGCKAFGADFNSGLFDVAFDDKDSIDKLCKDYAGHFAKGQQRKSGEAVSDSSRTTYASKFKLVANPAVHKLVDAIETQAAAYVKAVPFADRAKKNFFTLATAAASLVAKGKANKISREIFSGIVDESAKRSAARAAPVVLTEDQRKAAALESFRLAVIELQAVGLATKPIMANINPIAAAWALDVKPVKKAK